jgi:hypothetical protein
MFCPHCGKEVADDQLFCHHCGARMREDDASSVLETVQTAGGRERTPWEEREMRGFFRGLFATANDALFRPSEFFRKMSVTGGLTDPLLYALILGMIGIMFSYLWQIVTRGSMQGMIPGMQASTAPDMFHGVGLALFAFFSPFFIIMGMFVSAGILHVCLMLVKGTKSGFEGTFRVVAYGYSANIFMVIPFCGGILTAVWAIVLSIIGLREAHETTGGKAAFAVFLPVIVCCGLMVFVLALILGAAAGSLGMLLNQMQP